MVLQSIFEGPECSIQEILDSKEQRVSVYTKMARENKCSNIVTLCVNMPGRIKDNPASWLFFNEGYKLLKMLISTPVCSDEKHGKTGHEAYFGTHFDSFELKQSILYLESRYKWLRMLDIDVIDTAKGHISRNDLGYDNRKCFVCEKPAKECCSQACHTEYEIKEAITNQYIDLASYIVGNAAGESLIQEALCTPKPGLVDQNNNGSHKDMNLKLLTRSAVTLQPFFENMCKLGFTDAGLADLRALGCKAEQAMYKATGNVNTHKGAVFSLGLLSFCFGKCLLHNEKPTSERICGKVKELVKGIEGEVSAETYSKRGYGARGQAADGYSVITRYALPFYREVLKADEKKAMYLTLLLLISKTNDSNILSRSNAQTLEWAQQECLKLFNKSAEKEEVENLDKKFIEKNISPGGSADLLATTFFLHKISQDF